MVLHTPKEILNSKKRISRIAEQQAALHQGNVKVVKAADISRLFPSDTAETSSVFEVAHVLPMSPCFRWKTCGPIG